MPKTKRKRDRAAGESELSRHRARILFTLLGVCRNVERLQISPVARRACREVALHLDRTLAREIMAGPAPRRRVARS